jgi:hypothetical protein
MFGIILQYLWTLVAIEYYASVVEKENMQQKKNLLYVHKISFSTDRLVNFHFHLNANGVWMKKFGELSEIKKIFIGKKFSH